MKNTTFTVKEDDKTDVQYVVKCGDKNTKNHKKNENGIVSGYIPLLITNIAQSKASLSIHNPFILNLISFAKHPNTMVMKYSMALEMLVTIT